MLLTSFSTFAATTTAAVDVKSKTEIRSDVKITKAEKKAAAKKIAG